MSSSDDTSDSLASPRSYKDSPQRSPMQQVPQLVNLVSGMTCVENNTMHYVTNGARPMLRIIEQPQGHFRFRYRSEMVGTHGCLLGRNEGNSRIKTHPTVELANFSGRARIRCRLVQSNSDADHPHQLLEDEQDRDVSTEVGPEKGGYVVKFPGMGIIHTAKKDVAQQLFAKYSMQCNGPHADLKQLRARCENAAKVINLNIVRLKFSAHDLHTDNEICPPVFSDPIHNMKSAATNDLKICRISKGCGHVQGNENLFILVEKVNKKNIEVNFVEVCPDSGRELWRGKGQFTHSDVHHQYAIVCKTPPYRSKDITEDVEVFIELVRPSDGRTSERMAFTYRADHIYKSKKRKYSSYSSFGSSTGESLNSIELPATVTRSPVIERAPTDSNMINDNSHLVIPNVPSSNSDPLADALLESMVCSAPEAICPVPVLPQANAPAPINVQFSSSEYADLIDNQLMNFKQLQPEEDFRAYMNSNSFKELFAHYELSADVNVGTDLNSMDFLQSLQLQADCVKIKEENTEQQENDTSNIAKTNSEYTALYSQQDGAEVKKLLAELCNIIRHNKDHTKEEVCFKLRKLMSRRLNNGDTFLHMTLCMDMLSNMKFIVQLIDTLKMTDLLNSINHRSQTILQVAVMMNMPETVPFLVSKGCNPMIKDGKGNNAVHCAVFYQSCLSPLLCAIKTNNVYCDLNASNYEKQTALHLAAQYGYTQSASLLLSHGARCDARDMDGRTPLHLAVLDDHCAVAEALLARIPACDVDLVDGGGNTALQIVCGAQSRPHSADIVRLLLNKGADPLRTEGSSESAWTLCNDKPELQALLKEHLPSEFKPEDDIKSEPEDDFESTEEDFPESGLEELSQYIHEVSLMLDRSGGWRELAVRLHHDSLLNWYQKTDSPTATLLSQLKEAQDNFTSRSLAMILRDIGETEAANAIHRYID